MGAWDTILKYGGKPMKGMGNTANATGKVPVMRYCIPRRPFGEPGRRSKYHYRSCRRLCGLGKTDHRQKCRTDRQ